MGGENKRADACTAAACVPVADGSLRPWIRILWGKASGLPRYRCQGCGRTFNGLTKTPLAHLRQKEKWQEQAQSMIDGLSTAKTAERCYGSIGRRRHTSSAAMEAFEFFRGQFLYGIGVQRACGKALTIEGKGSVRHGLAVCEDERDSPV